MVLTTPFRRARFFAFLDPWADPGNTGYQNLQALVGLGSGGLFGVGLGASRAKWGFLPFAHTDFIFAIIGEELGLVGAVFVVALFVALGTFGVRTALRAPDRFGMLVCRRHHRLVRGAGVPQHRRGDRPAADHRRAAAVHLLRRLVAARDDVCRRAPPQRRPPPEDPGSEPRDLSPSSPAAAPPATCSPGSPWPRPWWRGATTARASTSSGSDRGVEAELVPAAGFALDELPGRGIAAPADAWPTSGRARPRPGHRARASGSCGATAAGGGRRARRPRQLRLRGAARCWPAGRSCCSSRTRGPARSTGSCGRFATASAVSFAGTDLPRATVTGNPVRPEIAAAAAAPDRAAASRRARAAGRPHRDRARSAAPWGRDGSTRRCAAWSSGGPTGATSPCATWSATRDWPKYSRPGRRRAATRAAPLPAGRVRGPHAPAAPGRRRRGHPRRGHGGRAGRARRAGGPRAAPDRHPRPPDRQRARPWSPPAARSSSPTPSSTSTGSPPSSPRSSTTPTAGPRWRRPCAAARPDAADRVADARRVGGPPEPLGTG